jgi:hypothetical protein
VEQIPQLELPPQVALDHRVVGHGQIEVRRDVRERDRQLVRRMLFGRRGEREARDDQSRDDDTVDEKSSQGIECFRRSPRRSM